MHSNTHILTSRPVFTNLVNLNIHSAETAAHHGHQHPPWNKRRRNDPASHWQAICSLCAKRRTQAGSLSAADNDDGCVSFHFQQAFSFRVSVFVIHALSSFTYSSRPQLNCLNADESKRQTSHEKHHHQHIRVQICEVKSKNIHFHTANAVGGVCVCVAVTFSRWSCDSYSVNTTWKYGLMKELEYYINFN